MGVNAISQPAVTPEDGNHLSRRENCSSSKREIQNTGMAATSMAEVENM